VIAARDPARSIGLLADVFEPEQIDNIDVPPSRTADVTVTFQ
jgi:hypothetical protein